MIILEFIEDRVNLYRAVPDWPRYWKNHFNRPSSSKGNFDKIIHPAPPEYWNKLLHARKEEAFRIEREP
ncbi:hypothetical protein JW964_23635, partial [candidate division KSB1 bacterium]|nr:hypothetical protein [candidate division KSB1 bacterium]